MRCMEALHDDASFWPKVHRRSLGAGIAGSGILAGFYVAVVWGASGSFGHLVDQIQADWYYLAAIIAGLGVQVALMAELRRRHRLHHTVAAAGGAGASASTAGMIACCAHHLADLAPFVGATGLATFLTDYRVPFMVLGIGVNAVGVVVASMRLRNAVKADRSVACSPKGHAIAASR